MSDHPSTLLPQLPEAPARAPAQPWHWRAHSLLSRYLPLTLMAVLAAFTWWLVKNTPNEEAPTAAPPVRHVPDYEMHGFELQRFRPDGTLQLGLQGQTMRHYPDDGTVEIDDIEVMAPHPDGGRVLARAQRGWSNAQGTQIELRGQVRVQREHQPGQALQLEIFTERLVIDTRNERLRSPGPALLRTPNGRIETKSLNYDHLSGQLSFQGRSTAQSTGRRGS